MALVLPSYRAPPPPAAASTTVVPLRILAWQALGTRCEVQYAATSETQAKAFEVAAVGWVAAFEAKYSRFRPDRLLSRINAAAGHAPVAIDVEMEQLLALCDRLHFMTQGVLDPTTLPLLRLWDYKAANPRLPTESEIAAARRLVGWKKVQRTPGHVFLPEPGMALDFGGFGKEWAVDIVAPRWLILATISVLSACRPVARRGTLASKIPPIRAPSKARSRSPAAKASPPPATTCVA
jgi:thiamine biosynthesis lipoprotein